MLARGGELMRQPCELQSRLITPLDRASRMASRTFRLYASQRKSRQPTRHGMRRLGVVKPVCRRRDRLLPLTNEKVLNSCRPREWCRTIARSLAAAANRVCSPSAIASHLRMFRSQNRDLRDGHDCGYLFWGLASRGILRTSLAPESIYSDVTRKNL